MNYIVDKNGKELNEKSNHKKRSWISKNMIAALTMIPIAGAMVNFIVKLYIYIYKMGYSSYFQIPNEYLLINDVGVKRVCKNYLISYIVH